MNNVLITLTCFCAILIRTIHAENAYAFSKIGIVDEYYRKAEDILPKVRDCDQNLSETYRLTSSSTRSLIIVHVGQDDERTIHFFQFDNTLHNPDTTIYKRQLLPYEYYSYFTNLLEQAQFWSLPEEYGDIGFHIPKIVIEGSRKGERHRVDCLSHTNTPLHLSGSFLYNLGPFSPLERDLRVWPMLAYFQDYDSVCLDLEGKDIFARQDEWRSWNRQRDYVEIFGMPHEVRTRPGETIWGYYLKDRGMMILSFDRNGNRNNINVTYSESGVPEIIPEWLIPTNIITVVGNWGQPEDADENSQRVERMKESFNEGIGKGGVGGASESARKRRLTPAESRE